VNVELPADKFKGRLDDRRYQALSRVRDRITAMIENQRQIFARAADQVKLDSMARGDVLRSSLTFGYLKLEGDRCLRLEDSERSGNSSDLLGVSFANLKQYILSMLELNGLKICGLSLAEKMPLHAFGLNVLSMYLGAPAVDTGPDIDEVRLSGGFKYEMARLIQEIDAEGWGIELNHIRLGDEITSED